ncbi:hypothetical protein ACT6NV_09315 [Robiginitalea sp. IMCC44478]|uniref:hypothetical protein n=1 Tax=Robiginitalea sp. IMCC44478 TaxID=3459122 RepID=UPI0040436F5E
MNKQDVLIEGKIIHNRTNEYSLNTEFVGRPDAHLIITIVYSEGMDGQTELVLEKDFESIAKLPFEFKIYGNKNEFMPESRNGKYLISAQLLNGSGKETYVGDLVSEYSYEIFNPFETEPQKLSEYIEIEVFGLEDCNDPNSGGYCTSNYRKKKKRASINQESIDLIIQDEFNLPTLNYKIDLEEVKKQETLPNNKIMFVKALHTALKTVLTSNSNRESPRIIISEGMGLRPKENVEDETKVVKQLHEFLLSGKLILLPLVDWENRDQDFGFFPPEEGESAQENWVFYLSLPTLSDHLFWIIVPRDGQSEAYVYGFN